MLYRFETVTTMKEYNNSKWWIDSGIIRPEEVEAETLKEALTIWRDIVQDKYYISISDNALKNKAPMYYDTKEGETVQSGYVITGATEFEDRDNYKWSKQYIDLWVNIKGVVNVF